LFRIFSKTTVQDLKVFFVATGVAEGTINLSPKGLDSLRVVENNRILWMNLTGSGNETAAHVQENPRMTLMMNAFEGKPLILRIYGQAKVIHHLDEEWKEFVDLFPYSEGSRQIFDLSIELVQTSCGWAVPEYEFKNFDITLSQFKFIFFWEYFHRIWGRLIGFTFIIPLIYFWLSKKLTGSEKKFFIVI